MSEKSPPHHNINSRSPSDQSWIDHPSSFFRSFAIIPTADMTNGQRINALTRLIVVIAVILFFFPVGSWWLFLLLGLGLIFLLFFLGKRNTLNSKMTQNYSCRRKKHKPTPRKAPTEKKPPFKLFPQP